MGDGRWKHSDQVAFVRMAAKQGLAIAAHGGEVTHEVYLENQSVRHDARVRLTHELDEGTSLRFKNNNEVRITSGTVTVPRLRAEVTVYEPLTWVVQQVAANPCTVTVTSQIGHTDELDRTGPRCTSSCRCN